MVCASQFPTQYPILEDFLSVAWELMVKAAEQQKTTQLAVDDTHLFQLIDKGGFQTVYYMRPYGKGSISYHLESVQMEIVARLLDELDGTKNGTMDLNSLKTYLTGCTCQNQDFDQHFGNSLQTFIASHDLEGKKDKAQQALDEARTQSRLFQRAEVREARKALRNVKEEITALADLKQIANGKKPGLPDIGLFKL